MNLRRLALFASVLVVLVGLVPMSMAAWASRPALPTSSEAAASPASYPMVAAPQALPLSKHIRPCVFEDGSGGPLPCRWDAGYVGPDSNGIGLSFNVYPVGKRAHGVQRVKYVYDDGHTEYGSI